MSKDTKLNNLLGMEDYSEKDFIKSAKPTKRTDVAKDVLHENTGKDVFTSKPKIEEIKLKSLNNLISLDDFSKEMPSKNSKSTKRTDVANDVLHEKKKTFTGFGKKKAKCDDDECAGKNKMGTGFGKKKSDCDDDRCAGEKTPKKGLTAGQKKLPEAMQRAILKKQGK
jgi:hypothetical protein